MSANIDEIRRNASAQGIPPGEVTLIYAGLTPLQTGSLKSRGLLVDDLGSGAALGRFDSDYEAMFPDKVTGAMSLGA